MKTKTTSIFLIILFTILSALGQTLLKIGAVDNLINLYVFFGLAVYGFGTIIFLVALKDGELSVLYPIISLSFIWVLLISFFYFGEEINAFRVTGVSSIIAGVILIGIKGRK